MAPPSRAFAGWSDRCIPDRGTPREPPCRSATFEAAMQRIAIMLAATAAALASTTATAAAATLTTDTRCYQETQEVVVNGTGFAANSIVTISRDDKVLGSTQTDVNGAFRNKFDTPELPQDVRERVYSLSATDTATTA